MHTANLKFQIIVVTAVLLLCSCAAPTQSGGEKPSVNLELWKNGENVPDLIQELTHTTNCDRLVFELRQSKVDAVRLEYSGNRFDELLNQCKEKFKNPRQIDLDKKTAVWKPVDGYYACIMLVYFSLDDSRDEPEISKNTTYLIISPLPDNPWTQQKP